VKSCCPDRLKIASRFCHLVSYSSRTEHLLVRQSWLKTGLPPTAVTSSEETNGHQTHQTSWLPRLGSYAWMLQHSSTQAKYHRRRKSCKQYGMICYRTPSTRPYWALSKDFELVWKLEVETLNTLSNILYSHGFELHSLKCQISMFSFDFNTSTMMKIVIFVVIVIVVV